jgi:non-homologous end joining protein Ku
LRKSLSIADEPTQRFFGCSGSNAQAVIPDEKIPKDMLELASHIVETKSGHFEPDKFEDQYEDALKELLKKKQAGEKIEAPKERAPAKLSI